MSEKANDNPNRNANASVGRLELIIGCMFSGKSTELIQRIRKYKLINRSYLAVTHQSDVRYDTNSIVSHDLLRESALPLSRLCQLTDDESSYKEQYLNAQVIVIEEGQFFVDLFDFVLLAVERDGKTVVISALDGDYLRKPFENVMRLIPLADTVDRRTALCSGCSDGTVAMFSQRTVESQGERELVGGAEAYRPVCRRCY
jgi:thymidine kinase